VKHATQYYKGLIGPGTGNALELDLDLCPPDEVVIEEENGDLIKPFNEEEIKKLCFIWKKIKL
jgi:hypothetical protein